VFVHVHVHGKCAAPRAQAHAMPWTGRRSLGVTARPARPTRWLARAGMPRRATVPRPHGPPGLARGLYRASGPRVLAEPVVHPAASHAARGHQVRDREAVRPGRQQRGPQRRFRPLGLITIGRAGSGRLLRFWGRLGRIRTACRHLGPPVRVPRSVAGCRRLVTAGLLPERAGQPSKVLAHISLADLLDLDTGSELQKEWTRRVCAQWAAHRAAASVSGSDGGAWLEGDAAKWFACDASITPVVTGDVNPAVLEDLVRLCVQLAGYGLGDNAGPGCCQDDQASPDHTGPAAGQASPAPCGRDALQQAIIGKAVALLSGPAGLASFLRRQQLGGRLGGPSLPLDVGVSRDIPAAIRTAVIARDKHCRFPDGCFL
jgi:hypothetical protein